VVMSYQLERQGDVQKPLAAGQGKTVPNVVLLVVVVRNVPGGLPRPLVGESPGSGQRAGEWPLTLGCTGVAVGSVQV
jgi:hypothetical protein